jgi:hypothetical protein
MSVERGTSCISFLPETLLLTSDWPHHHHRLYVLRGPTPHVQHPPVRPPLTSTVTFSASLLADPLGFEDPLPSIPFATRTHCWLDIIAATARFLHCVRLTPFPLAPYRPTAHPLICGHHYYHGQSE